MYYGISTLAGYLMPNPVYTYIMAGYCRLFNAKSCLYKYILNIYMICK